VGVDPVIGKVSFGSSCKLGEVTRKGEKEERQYAEGRGGVNLRESPTGCERGGFKMLTLTGRDRLNQIKREPCWRGDSPRGGVWPGGGERGYLARGARGSYVSPRVRELSGSCDIKKRAMTRERVLFLGGKKGLSKRVSPSLP